MNTTPASGRWYHYDDAHNPMNNLPIVEDSETGFSVDVLVYGFAPKQPACFGIGYVDGNQHWCINTSNGYYTSNDDEAPFTVLAWQYLPDVPAPYDNILHLPENG